MYRGFCLTEDESQYGCKTSNDVQCRDMGSEESTREEVRCEDVKMDGWSHQGGRIRSERIRGTTKVGEISKNVG